MKILRICLEEQLQVMYDVIMHLISLEIQNMLDINADSLQWLQIFDKNFSSLANKYAADSGIKNMPNKKLAEDLHKPIIKKLEKRKLHSSFIDNIWGGDLGNMQLINTFDKGIRFLLCVIYIVSKYAWVIPLKIRRHYNY